MGIFKALFGSSAEPVEKVRRLSHPEDLRQGDIIRFAYLSQPDISNTEFEVTQVNTYIYGDLCYPEMVLKDRAGNLVYLMVEDDDGDEYIAVSRKIPKTQMHEVISQDDLARINSSGTGTTVRIVSQPHTFNEWFADSYREVDDNVKGAFVKGDARTLSEEELNRREPFTSHILEDESGEFALEIEMYGTGELELCVTVYHDLDEIAEMWPGKAGE